MIKKARVEMKLMRDISLPEWMLYQQLFEPIEKGRQLNGMPLQRSTLVSLCFRDMQITMFAVFINVYPKACIVIVLSS